jgi:DNA polymerase III delta prime subunit
MKELFINKYKPKYFKDYDTDIEIIKTLKMLLKTDNTNILLSGDYNSGKSTILNTIFEEYFLNIPYSDYNNNILYINNISDQGINYYRNDVKIFCQIRCNIPGKKKMIIMDDIDLINEQSQQVFRSFIDNYSNNVFFIASTSNIQKVIDSLQTRFNILKIEPFKKSSVLKIMNKIKTNESISMDKEAEDFIINISNYNIKLLIQYMHKCKLINKHIIYQLATDVCCGISFFIFEKYTNYVKERKLGEAIDILLDLYNKGYSIIDIFDGYFLFIKKYDNIDEESKYKIIKYICKYISIFYNIHEDEIELSFFTNNIIELFS